MDSLKSNDYLCPKCKGHLNADESVIFSTKNAKNQRGLILLSPEIGKYNYSHHDNYNFKKGEIVEFYCPICAESLESDKNNKYASITMIDHNNEEYEMLFSRLAGNKSTYIVSNRIVESFGEDSSHFDEVLS